MTLFPLPRTASTLVRIVALTLALGGTALDAGAVAAQPNMLTRGDGVTVFHQSVAHHGGGSFLRGRIGFLAD